MEKYNRTKRKHSSELAKNLGSLSQEIQYLLVRIGICTTNPESPSSSHQSYDQIVVLSGKEYFETSDFKFANFNDSVSEESQIIHELLHPIGWQIAKNINPDFENSPFNYLVEILVGGIHLALDDGSTPLTYSSIKNRVQNFYLFVFQSTIKKIYQNKFSQNKEVKKSLRGFLYLHYPNLKNCYFQPEGIKNQGYSEIIANYNYTSQQDASIFGINFWQEIQNVHKEDLINAIKIVVSDIENNNKFNNWIGGKIPTIEDCLMLSKRYSPGRILEMIYSGNVEAPGEMWDKYKNEES